jgi:hypothetical protein
MEEPALTALANWQNFYVIVGSSAGALTGLQFVVITLIAQAGIASSMREIRAFGSPTTVHFCMALLISAIASCPWHGLTGPALLFGICAVAGVIYALGAIRHAKKQTGYQPDWEDWMWFGWLPLVIYAALGAAAFLMIAVPRVGLSLIAAIALAFLFIGIHNSWDTVIYIAVQRPQERGANDRKD